MLMLVIALGNDESLFEATNCVLYSANAVIGLTKIAETNSSQVRVCNVALQLLVQFDHARRITPQ